jgi:hypothetical protein
MNKFSFSVFCATFIVVANAVFAYSTSGTNSDNSKATKYYRGEISADEYLDHLGVPKSSYQNQKTVRGELRKNDIGGGYTYKDSTGRHSEYYQNPYGGYDVYSNE